MDRQNQVDVGEVRYLRVQVTSRDVCAGQVFYGVRPLGMFGSRLVLDAGGERLLYVQGGQLLPAQEVARVAAVQGEVQGFFSAVDAAGDVADDVAGKGGC